MDYTSYNTFWQQFCKIVPRESTCTVHPRHSIVMKKSTCRPGQSAYTLAETLLLKDLPHAPKGCHLDAIVDCEEVFEPGFPNCPARTSITVYYFTRNLNVRHQAQALYALRFDYHPKEGGADGDPLMHMHIESEMIADSKRPEPYRKMQVIAPPAGHTALHAAVGAHRVPTARMPLPGVLCFLVADHCRKGVVRTLLKQTDGILATLQAPSQCSSWFDSSAFTKSKDVFCGAWYRY